MGTGLIDDPAETNPERFSLGSGAHVPVLSKSLVRPLPGGAPMPYDGLINPSGFGRWLQHPPSGGCSLFQGPDRVGGLGQEAGFLIIRPSESSSCSGSWQAARSAARRVR